jgi:tripartite-type tricarboxylate transporter receptor subunit TctC
MKLRGLVSLVFMMALVAGNAAAQGYPDGRPIRLIVPFPPGGSVDTVGRWITKHLSEAWKQPVLVENRAGAGGNVGADAVAKADPDGHTLLITTPGLAAGRSIYRKLPFDASTDFTPITQLTATYFILVVHPSVPAKSVKELIAYAKAHPGKLNYGSSGSGATLHLATEQFKIAAGIDIVHVPYKGEAPAYAALLANEVQVVLGPVSGLLPQIKAGRLRALAVSTSERVAQIPDVPTISEAGLPGFEFTSWFGLFAPARTPPDVVTKIQRDVAKIVMMPDVKDRLPEMGADAVGSTPLEFTARFKKDLDQYARTIEAAGIPKSD